MSPGHVAIFRSINRSINLALANCTVPAIIWCFASLTGLTILNKNATSVAVQQDRRSVSAVVYRAFVFAAPQVFRRASVARRNAKGAVSVGAAASARGNAIAFLTSH
jgi:hypothetical protein